MKKVLMLIIILMATGCASPRPVQNDRQGLLARMANADRVGHDGEIGVAERGGGKAKHVKSARGQSPAIDRESASLRWPVSRVKVTSRFGQRGSEFHEGLDLGVEAGTPVYAAQGGTVLYAGNRIRGYGDMVVIKHANDLATVYAHNSGLYVRRGQIVKKGQRIAISGESGKASGPHLHFEIRQGVKAVDPLQVLPKKVGTKAAVRKQRVFASR